MNSQEMKPSLACQMASAYGTTWVKSSEKPHMKPWEMSVLDKEETLREMLWIQIFVMEKGTELSLRCLLRERTNSKLM